MTTFMNRLGTQVTVDDGVTLGGKALNFPTAEQAELYEIVITKKIYYKDENFAQDLCRAKNPSVKQMHWVGKLIANTAAYYAGTSSTTLAAPKSADKVDLTKVLAMFNHARQHLKRPKITLMLKGGGKMRLSYDKGYAFMWLNNPLSYSGTYGRVELDGSIVWRRAGLAVKQEVMDILNEFCANPQQVAIVHGKLSGCCCFCTLPLTDPRSLHVGYGEICASHYRLPWGEKSKFTAEGDWVLNGATA